MKLKFQALALHRSKTFYQPTYPEEAADAIPANNKEKQLLFHLIKMTPVITPEKNENIQKNVNLTQLKFQIKPFLL